VYAAIWWRNADNPEYSGYVIHDCQFYLGGAGSGQAIFTDCDVIDGDEFEVSAVDFWILKEALERTLPPPPESRLT